MAGASEGAVMGGLVRGVDFVGFDEVRDKIAEQDDTLCWKDINVEKFEEDPRGYLDILFIKRGQLAPLLPVADWEAQVLRSLHAKYLTRRFENKEELLKIPSMNDETTVKVKNGQVVRFRCMLQDHLRSEYSMSHYTVTDPITGLVTKRSTFLRDDLLIEEYDITSSELLVEKELFVGLSPPGENFWVIRREENRIPMGVEKKKTKLDENDKNAKLDDGYIALPNYKDIVPSVFLNIGDTKPTACVLKMYTHNEIDWKYNDVVDVIGLIQVNRTDVSDAEGDDEWTGPNTYPELNKLPIIHVFSCVRLAEGSPYLPQIEGKLCPLFDPAEVRWSDAVQTLRDLLALGLNGDRYAAAYAMIALTCKGESLGDGSVGKYVLNISGLPQPSDVPEMLMYILKSLVPRTTKLEFKIENANKWILTPKKNLRTSQLEPSILQLPIGTHLIIDETGLKEGQFDDLGTKNIAVLKELLQEQKVKYDYTYQQPQLEANFPIIIFSTEKSVLPFDVQIILNPDGNLDPTERRTRIEQILSEKGEMLRNFIALQRARPLPKVLSDPALMEDIVQYLPQRNNSTLYSSKMTGHEFSAFITSCKRWCMLHGASAIDRDGFMFWKELERIRDSRVVPKQ